MRSRWDCRSQAISASSGYDNSLLARTGYIGLTTVDNNYAEMGRIAAHQLARRIETPDAPRSVTLLDPSLRPRRTSAPPTRGG